MIRLTRLADYAVVLMSHIANNPQELHNTSDLSEATQVPLPTVGKILGLMRRAGYLNSHRGLNGGFKLAGPPERISVADIISVVDGPIAITECTDDAPGECDFESFCTMRGHLRRINSAIKRALDDISLAEIAAPQAVFLDPPELQNHTESRAT